MELIKKAFRDLLQGLPVIIYDGDGREGECDIVLSAEHASSEMISRMRRDAGGLICAAVPQDIAQKLGLSYMADILSGIPAVRSLVISATPYGDKSAFSISINHRKTFTGITDKDRSLTIRELARLAKNPDKKSFAGNFYSPGHVPLLIGAEGLLEKRKGHTELSLTLSGNGAVVLCEMLDEKTGKALSKEDAQAYSRKNRFVFLEGEEIVRWKDGGRE